MRILSRPGGLFLSCLEVFFSWTYVAFFGCEFFHCRQSLPCRLFSGFLVILFLAFVVPLVLNELPRSFEAPNMHARLYSCAEYCQLLIFPGRTMYSIWIQVDTTKLFLYERWDFAVSACGANSEVFR
jgi:hypothetical protein